MIKIICKFCKKEFQTYPCRLRKKRQFCSKRCWYSFGFSKETKQKMSKARIGRFKGINHPRWKGQYRCNYHNRILIRQPTHPNADKRGYVRQSHFIMTKHLGRCLTKGEVVHHINGIKDDDRIENLQLFETKGLHISFHNKGKKKKPFTLKHIKHLSESHKGYIMPESQKKNIGLALKKYHSLC